MKHFIFCINKNRINSPTRPKPNRILPYSGSYNTYPFLEECLIYRSSHLHQLPITEPRIKTFQVRISDPMLFSEGRQILYILAYSHVYGRDRLIQVTGTKHKTVFRRILENLLDRHDSINITGSLLHQPEIKGGIRILFDHSPDIRPMPPL